MLRFYLISRLQIYQSAAGHFSGPIREKFVSQKLNMHPKIDVTYTYLKEFIDKIGNPFGTINDESPNARKFIARVTILVLLSDVIHNRLGLRI